MASPYLLSCVTVFAILNGALALTDGFAREPSNITVNAGETVTLYCTVNSVRNSYLYVYWYKSYGFSDKPTTPISSQRTIHSNVDSRYSIVGSGLEYNLRIVNVQVRDTSSYKCRYYNGGHFDSQTARLTVYDESFIPRCSYQPQNPDIGSMVSILCSPSAAISRNTLSLWRGTNGHQIQNVDRGSDGSIRYRFVVRDNDNNRPYTCNPARTYHDIHNCSVTPLNITPTITLTPTVNYGLANDTIRFSCKATGLPIYSTYRWLVGVGSDTQRITTSTGRYIFSTNGDSARLTIIGLRLSDNNTVVRCVAANDLGHRMVALGKMSLKIPLTNNEMTTAQPEITVRTDGSISDVQSVPPTTQEDVVTDERETGMWKLPTHEEGDIYSVSSQQDHETEILTSLNKSPNKRPSAILPVMLTLLFILGIFFVVVFLLFVKSSDNREEIMKRLSICKPVSFKKIPFRRPSFLRRSSVAKSWQGAKQKIETLQRRATWGGPTRSENEQKRQSLRGQIEVVVNPPPPEWKLKVEDVIKAQRQRLVSQHAPTGEYSEKERALLTSLVTGTIQVKTLERLQGIEISQIEGDDCHVIQQAADLEVDPSEGGRSNYTERRNESQISESLDNGDLPKVATIVASDTDNSTTRSDKLETESGENLSKAIHEDPGRPVAPGEKREMSSPPVKSNDKVEYAELDLKLSGPWDQTDRIIQSDDKTTYAVIDHSKRKPKVRVTCDL